MGSCVNGSHGTLCHHESVVFKSSSDQPILTRASSDVHYVGKSFYTKLSSRNVLSTKGGLSHAPLP